MGEWSGIPKDLLESIFERLENDLMDCLRFSAVCRQWKLMAIEKGRHALPRIMLMIHDEDGEFHSEADDDNLFSLSCANNHYKSHLPNMQGKRCCGSLNGSLIIVDRNSGVIHLVNPICGSQIPLPTPSVLVIEEQETGPISKVRVFLSWSSDEDYVVLVYRSQSKSAYFCRKGNEKWTAVNIQFGGIVDAAYFRDKLYAITGNGNIEVFDLQTPEFKKSVIRIKRPNFTNSQVVLLLRFFADVMHLHAPHRYKEDGMFYKVYLVNTPDEQLFMIIRYVVSSLHQAVGFKVFKLVEEGVGEWNEEKSLGERVVFVGQNSVCIMARDVPECQGNSIYFTDSYDTGVFNMEDQSIKPLCECGPSLHSPTTWFSPNVQLREV